MNREQDILMRKWKYFKGKSQNLQEKAHEADSLTMNAFINLNTFIEQKYAKKGFVRGAKVKIVGKEPKGLFSNWAFFKDYLGREATIFSVPRIEYKSNGQIHISLSIDGGKTMWMYMYWPISNIRLIK